MKRSKISYLKKEFDMISNSSNQLKRSLLFLLYGKSSLCEYVVKVSFLISTKKMSTFAAQVPGGWGYGSGSLFKEHKSFTKFHKYDSDENDDFNMVSKARGFISIHLEHI